MYDEAEEDSCFACGRSFDYCICDELEDDGLQGSDGAVVRSLSEDSESLWDLDDEWDDEDDEPNEFERKFRD